MLVYNVAKIPYRSNNLLCHHSASCRQRVVLRPKRQRNVCMVLNRIDFKRCQGYYLVPCACLISLMSDSQSLQWRYVRPLMPTCNHNGHSVANVRQMYSWNRYPGTCSWKIFVKARCILQIISSTHKFISLTLMTSENITELDQNMYYSIPGCIKRVKVHHWCVYIKFNPLHDISNLEGHKIEWCYTGTDIR